MAHINEKTDKAIEVFVRVIPNEEVNTTVKAIEVITKLDRSFDQIILKASEQANA